MTRRYLGAVLSTVFFVLVWGMSCECRAQNYAHGQYQWEAWGQPQYSLRQTYENPWAVQTSEGIRYARQAGITSPDYSAAYLQRYMAARALSSSRVRSVRSVPTGLMSPDWRPNLQVPDYYQSHYYRPSQPVWIWVWPRW